MRDVVLGYMGHYRSLLSLSVPKNPSAVAGVGWLVLLLFASLLSVVFNEQR